MFAIVEVAGQQFKVEKETRLFVHRLDEKEGGKIYLDKVLLIDNEGKVKIGTPVISNARVSATVKAHLKGDKVRVFKKKRRKGYQVLNGHRQYFTEIVVTGIEEKSAPAKTKAEKPSQKPTEKAKSAPAAKSAGAQKSATAKKGTPATKAKSEKVVTTKSGTAKAKPAAKPKATTKATTAETTTAKTKAATEKKESKTKKPAQKSAAKAKTDSGKKSK